MKSNDMEKTKYEFAYFKYVKSTIAILVALFIVFSASLLPTNAYAVNAGEDGYVENFMENETKGFAWNEEIVTNVEGYSGSDNAAQNSGQIVEALSTMLTYVANSFLALGLIMFIGRLVGRAIWEMLDDGQHTLPKILKANSKENGKGDREWVFPMLKSCALYFAIAIGVWTLLSLIASIVSFAWSAAA